MESNIFNSYYTTIDHLCSEIETILCDTEKYIEIYIDYLYEKSSGTNSDFLRSQLNIIKQKCFESLDHHLLSSLRTDFQKFKTDLVDFKKYNESKSIITSRKNLKEIIKTLSTHYWGLLNDAFCNLALFIKNNPRNADDQKLILIKGKFDSETIRYFYHNVDYFEWTYNRNLLNKLITNKISEDPKVTDEILLLIQFCQHGFGSLDPNNVLVVFTIRDLRKLENMNVKNYGFSQIKTRAFYYCSNLSILDLSYNMINSIHEDTFSHLVNLTRLDLTFNKLKSLPKSAFKHLKNLLMLNLSENDIVTLENGCFDGLDNLMQLCLSNNYINSLDGEVFTPLKNLKNLLLDRNFIKVINQNNFKGLNNLKLLDLNTNSIEKIKMNSISQCEKLSVLFLNDNCLPKLGRFMFKDLHILTTLNISKNRLVFIGESTFCDLINLRELDLSRNKLTKISDKTFKPLENLKYINFNLNTDLRTNIYIKTNETAVIIFPKRSRYFFNNTKSNSATALAEKKSDKEEEINFQPKNSSSNYSSKSKN